MSKIKAVYDNEEDFSALPEEVRALYEERDGTWELVGVEGVKTQADVTRLQEALRKERAEHAKARSALKEFGDDVTPEKVRSLQDEIEDLRLKLDSGEGGEGPSEEQINEMVERRIQARLRPLEREKKRLEDEKNELMGALDDFRQRETKRSLQDRLRDAATKAKGGKVRSEALEDIELYAERIFQRTEDGQFLTRPESGFPEGLTPDAWLEEVRESGRKPHWFESSQSAGARGGNGAVSDGGTNPFKLDSDGRYNLTKIGQLVDADPDKAVRMAKAAGRVDLLPRDLRPSE